MAVSVDEEFWSYYTPAEKARLEEEYEELFEYAVAQLSKKPKRVVRLARILLAKMTPQELGEFGEALTDEQFEEIARRRQQAKEHTD